MEKGLMDYGEFKEKACMAMNERLGSMAEVKIVTVEKNNGIKHEGLEFVNKAERTAPVVYLEKVYERYNKGEDITSLLDEIQKIYEDSMRYKMFDLSVFMDWGKAEKNIKMRLVNYEMNMEKLKTMPYKRFLDLAVIFYIDTENGQCSAVIGNDMLGHYGKTEEEVYEAAVRNMETPVAMGINEIMKENKWDGEIPEEGHAEMYVLTNDKKMFGAAAMLNKGLIRGVLEKAGRKKGYIIPSSVHEVILVPVYEDADAGELKEMVREVNDSSVAALEILSYNVYVYDMETDEVTIA